MEFPGCKRKRKQLQWICIVRGKDPRAKGKKGDFLILLKEQPDNSQILEIGVICVDGQKYPEETWLDVAGEQVEL